jgi:hypothetical protein
MQGLIAQSRQKKTPQLFGWSVLHLIQVIPAKAGNHSTFEMGPGFRRGDEFSRQAINEPK